MTKHQDDRAKAKPPRLPQAARVKIATAGVGVDHFPSWGPRAPEHPPLPAPPPPIITHGNFTCAGLEGCVERVFVRGGKCPRCTVELPRQLRRQLAEAALESVSPGGCRDEIRAGTKLYETTTRRIRAALPHLHRLGGYTPAEFQKLGPTGIGKSKVLVALAHQLIDTGLEGSTAAMKRGAGVRYINLHLLSEEQRAHNAGGGKGWLPKVTGAVAASELFADEVGFEGNTFLMKYMLRARYEARAWGPVYVASNAPDVDTLNGTYGENNIRTIWEHGLVIDLFEAVRRGDADLDRGATR